MWENIRRNILFNLRLERQTNNSRSGNNVKTHAKKWKICDELAACSCVLRAKCYYSLSATEFAGFLLLDTHVSKYKCIMSPLTTQILILFFWAQDGSYPGTGKIDEVGHGDGHSIHPRKEMILQHVSLFYWKQSDSQNDVTWESHGNILLIFSFLFHGR